MFMPSKRQMRLRGNLVKSIGSLSGPAPLVPWPGSQNDFVKNFQGLRLWPSSRWALSHSEARPAKETSLALARASDQSLRTSPSRIESSQLTKKKRLKLVFLSFEIITCWLGEAAAQSWPLYNSSLHSSGAATLSSPYPRISAKST